MPVLNVLLEPSNIYSGYWVTFTSVLGNLTIECEAIQAKKPKPPRRQMWSRSKSYSKVAGSWSLGGDWLRNPLTRNPPYSLFLSSQKVFYDVSEEEVELHYIISVTVEDWVVIEEFYFSFGNSFFLMTILNILDHCMFQNNWNEFLSLTFSSIECMWVECTTLQSDSFLEFFATVYFCWVQSCTDQCVMYCELYWSFKCNVCS